ncbi:MAG: hypothetical protein NVSMB9_03740 [Isosphaeraceae bacterium]
MSLKPYLQLVRLPNIFTAAADSMAGWLLVQGTFGTPRHWLPLVLASVCIYAGGIVLNDVLDLDIDRRERPGRPIPSGRVRRGTAALLGGSLLALGFGLAILSGTRYGGLVAAALVGSVLAYDLGIKRTLFGPEVMGLCRGLNLLLGMSHAEQLGGLGGWLVVGAYATFVMGITWISRSEVESGPWKNVALGALLENLALLVLIVVSVFSEPLWHPGRGTVPQVVMGTLVLVVIGINLNRKTLRGLRDSSPSVVQGAVKLGILSLVWLHVGVLLAARGPSEALVVGLFWIPATFTGRWIYST